MRHIRQRIDTLTVQPHHITQRVRQLPVLGQALARAMGVHPKQSSRRHIERNAAQFRSLANPIERLGQNHVQRQHAQIMQQPGNVRFTGAEFLIKRCGFDKRFTQQRHGK